MSESPKLYAKKPKKAQLKQFQEQNKGKNLPSTSSSSTAASNTMSSQTASNPPPPPLQPPKESFARRYKFLWPLLLAVNLTVGAYLFMRTNKKEETSTTEDVAKDVGSTTPVSTTTAATTVTAPPVTEQPSSLPSITQPVKLPEPIPESQQRELFKHLLEEKRKIKPKNPEEKKRLDEEKAILKQFIRAKSIPTI